MRNLDADAIAMRRRANFQAVPISSAAGDPHRNGMALPAGPVYVFRGLTPKTDPRPIIHLGSATDPGMKTALNLRARPRP